MRDLIRRNRILITIAAMTVLIMVSSFGTESVYASSWPSYRGNKNNNAVGKYKTPIAQETTEPAWVKQFGDPVSGMGGWNYAPNTPIIVDGELITTSAKSIQRISISTGKVNKTGELDFAVNWGYTPITYEEINEDQGVLFCPLAGGSIEAVDRDSLEKIWTFSMATVSFRMGSDGVYSYYNNKLFVAGYLAEKYFPVLKKHECNGVSYCDALVAAHIDKYGEDAVKDNLDITYDTGKQVAVVNKMFGSSTKAELYKRNTRVTGDLSSSVVQNGYDLFVKSNSSDCFGFFDNSEISQEFDKQSDKATVKIKLKCNINESDNTSSAIIPYEADFRLLDTETGEYTDIQPDSFEGGTEKAKYATVKFKLAKGIYYIAASGKAKDLKGMDHSFSDALVKVMIYQTDEEKASYEYDSASATHQSLSPIVCSDGMLYTGFYKGYNQYDYYMALDAKTGEIVWKVLSPGGFYWNGAVAVGDAIIVGTQDGFNNNDVTGASGGPSADSRILAFERKTGEIISEYVLPNASDICSSIVYDEEGTGRIFWTTCGGYICSAAVNKETGEISDVKQVKIAGTNALTVSTPVVYNGRVYFGYTCKESRGRLGVCRASTLSEIFHVDMLKYSKSSPLLTNAYEEDTGFLYLYMVQYDTPGGVYVIKLWNEASDASSKTDVNVSELFSANGYSQYSAASLIADDSKGQLYYKNDSNSIFAIRKCNKVTLGKISGVTLTPSSSAKKVTLKWTKYNGANGYRILGSGICVARK